ncbi:E3 ubiquitin-protein ligase TRIM71-like [Saccostrea cucullata]|uniref:E3 ubiquitin-protein ligase TRIM71-like n=1 Tax=Saccostrea cuccullata TaxID=36930 RepID=UPI002ED5F99C
MDPRTSAQDVMRCDLCETAVVQMHCDTCLVNLCKACIGEHMISDQTKKHEIVTFQSRKSTLLYPRCKVHADNSCEFHCKECDIPICSACIVSKKHKDHDVQLLKDILAKKKAAIQIEINELDESIYPTYQDIASDVQNTMSQLEKEYGDLSIAITKHGEDWHREIDKLVKKLKAEVDEMKNKDYEILKAHLSNVQTCTSKINEDINSLHEILDSTDISKVLKFPLDSKRYRMLPSKLNITMAKFSPFSVQERSSEAFGKIISPTISSDNHGYSIRAVQGSLLGDENSTLQNKRTEAGSSPPVKQLLDEPETVTIINTGYGYLYNVACLSDEEIWTSGLDSTMNLYSINQGSLLKSITIKSGNKPSGIAVTKSGDLVYTDYDDRAVNIVKNEKIEEVIRLQNWRPWGVCSTSSGDLLVIMYSDDYKQTKVVRYSGSTEKQTIQFDDKGKPLYLSGGDYYRYITENRNLDICVSDGGARVVVVVNQAGKLRFRYTGHTPAPKNKSFSPRGITTDSQSHTLTADVNNECVHIIDQDGQFLRYIDCGLSEPKGLCTDTNDNLLVAQYRNKQVRKIKYQN